MEMSVHVTRFIDGFMNNKSFSLKSEQECYFDAS